MLDVFTRLKKLSGKQIAEIRRTIQERDELISSSSGSGGKAAVQLSARVRELLRGVQDTHGKMQAQVAKEEKDLAKGKRNLPYTQEDLEAHREIAVLVSKHITECEVDVCLTSLPLSLTCCFSRSCVCVWVVGLVDGWAGGWSVVFVCVGACRGCVACVRAFMCVCVCKCV